MKRGYETTYYSVPYDVYGIIHHYLTSASKSTMRQLDKEHLSVYSKLAKNIIIKPPQDLSKTPDNIYQILIERFPNIRKLIFESCYFEVDKKVFQKQIHALIEFLNKNKDKHPLSHIKEMDIREIECDNPLFLRALSHSGLESVTWRTFYAATPLNGKSIQPILEKAIGLKHFQIHGIFESFHNNLSFANQSELTSVLFDSNVFGSAKTIKSLSQCKKLEKLATGYHYFTAHSIEKTFNSNPWNLKHLILTVPSQNANVSFTKQMPLLECLTILSGHPSNNLISLGTNCPNLRELRVEKLTLEDDKIVKMLQGLSKLEVLIFKSPHEPSRMVLESLKNNCPEIDSHESKSTVTAWKQWTYYSSKNTMPTFG
jgi:hypothetical protein